MNQTPNIIGSATRVIIGRNAVQRVYWRSVQDEHGVKLLKYNKTCTFDKNLTPSKLINEELSERSSKYS